MKEFKLFAKQLALASGKLICNYYRTNISVEKKADESPVTIADKKAEELMRKLIMKEYPEHGIVGEEFGIYNPGAEYKWILDPIDGTKSFICGTPLFGTLIALTKNNEPIIGVINHPILKEFLIGDNNSAQLNGLHIKIKDVQSLSEAVLLTTDYFLIEKYKNINLFNALTKQVRLTRTWGDCYGYYLLAAGYAQIMIDPIMSLWDLMALIPIVKGAGGIITDYEGNDPAKGNSIVAATPNIHKSVINILNN
jgi:myo-inositol-1(or 4)-monophosphatase